MSAPHDWYIAEYGGGVMISEPKFFGCAFLRNPENAEDLDFVARAKSEPKAD
jgi:hypothetical protein